MIWNVVAIFDSALASFGRPFVTPSIGIAIRAFTDAINGEDKEMSRHPKDYDLFKLAEFDDVKGQFKSEEAPVSLARGNQVMIVKE